MSYYHNHGHGDSKPVRKPVNQEAYEQNSYEAPKPESVDGNSLTLQAKAFRDLSNIGVIDVKADPNAEMSYGAFPYTIIGRTSPVIDASYPGNANIAGNSITMLQNDTTKSQLMNVFDVACVYKKINYNYLPIKHSGTNSALASEMIKSIEQAVSFGFSTMLTQLPFATATYASTDLPIASNLANSKAAGYYKALVHYQCVQQALVQPIAKYIELRSLEREMMRMSFRTEAPLITQMMGLFKKASFVSVINTIGTVVINEYFDIDWYRQMNTLLCVPSRKTVGMMDPLLTLIGIHAIPNLTINSTQYDSSKLTTGASSSLLDPDTFSITTGAKDLETCIMNTCKLMNPAYIFRFVRLMNRNALPSGSITTISAYVEQVKTYLSYIAQFAASFSTAMSDIRTFLDKLSQSNMVYWKKGISFFVDKIVQLNPSYNALLNDVFQATYAGADTIKFDANTKRWRAWAFWNKYTGIPEFDRMSGGSFLTFGLRNLSSVDSDGNAIDMNSSAGLIPVLFTNDTGDSGNLIVTRTGASASVGIRSLTNNNLGTNPYLIRLNPLDNTDISLKMPDVATTITDDKLRARFESAVLLFIGNTFGYGNVHYTTGSGPDAVTTDCTILDPDYVAFVDLEIEDVSNQMIVFARNYAPFRVDTPDPKRPVGFSSVPSSSKAGLSEANE